MKVTTIPISYPLEEEQVANLKTWTDALRGGKYKQCMRQLATTEHTAFCCLGVACDIMEIPKKEGSFLFNNGPLDLLPDNEWFEMKYGFDPKRPVASYIANENQDPYKGHIANMNDYVGMSFSKIADVIEAVFIDRVVKEIES